ncbi:DEAD-box ATP-dependent RNA helicase 40 [Carex littledalei]|uniref:DEAD-box ATP-dependent RNA helicase 40 n=1 Tax=Carex littledalei TaxID=544730 RepID=A0A833W271_9POAL|nr:DEAD-box ATP-dependent RNA helicase 40 [Carex littledalei]KAF3340709.1 DEAD-box ATP-dependent RNA helicase 40 [Carex littledalei]
MAATEAATDASGPRFAPDDPTLPEPWKGLIDGNTGMLYYWNQETNVTQYERPPAEATGISDRYLDAFRCMFISIHNF